MIIAIDGPAGAGKSTVAKIIAQKLGFLYIDTGAMYRALTLKVLQEKIGIKEKAKIIETASRTKIDLINTKGGSLRVLLDNLDVTKDIRQPLITKFVSDIAKIKEVRQIILKLERELGKHGYCVLDGRDIGTVVFPDANRKFYIDADFKERVERRFKELKVLSQNVTRSDVERDLENRDTIDSTRKIAPLKKAKDAICIDTTNMSIDEVVNKVLKWINP